MLLVNLTNKFKPFMPLLFRKKMLLFIVYPLLYVPPSFLLLPSSFLFLPFPLSFLLLPSSSFPLSFLLLPPSSSYSSPILFCMFFLPSSFFLPLLFFLPFPPPSSSFFLLFIAYPLMYVPLFLLSSFLFSPLHPLSLPILPNQLTTPLLPFHSQLKAKPVGSGKDELEKQLEQLRENIFQKQVQIETLASENGALQFQLERDRKSVV